MDSDVASERNIPNPSCPLSGNNILPIRRPPITFSLDREDTLDDTITTTYYLCEEFLKAIGHRDDPQVRLSTAEVMTMPLVACAFFSGNLEASRSFLDEYGFWLRGLLGSSATGRSRLAAYEAVLHPDGGGCSQRARVDETCV
jgi:hypothetical protein